MLAGLPEMPQASNWRDNTPDMMDHREPRVTNTSQIHDTWETCGGGRKKKQQKLEYHTYHLRTARLLRPAREFPGNTCSNKSPTRACCGSLGGDHCALRRVFSQVHCFPVHFLHNQVLDWLNEQLDWGLVYLLSRVEAEMGMVNVLLFIPFPPDHQETGITTAHSEREWATMQYVCGQLHFGQLPL